MVVLLDRVVVLLCGAHPGAVWPLTPVSGACASSVALPEAERREDAQRGEESHMRGKPGHAHGAGWTVVAISQTAFVPG